MSDCLVTNFGILTNGAFSVCFRRSVGFYGRTPARQQEVIAPMSKITNIKYEKKDEDNVPIIIIKEVT